ncbi:MAG: hypothetical protein NTX46_06440 [Chloroflexi bacterium]|nr:hypothetical protein [Chloroflexota bacterium]
MKILKIFGIVIGSIIGLVIIIGAVVWVLMSRPSSIASNVTQVPSNAQAVQSFDTKWDNFNNTVAQASPGTQVTVTLTQEEVNSKINEELKTVDLPAGLAVSNMNVNLVDGKILLSADIKYSIFSGNAGMEATVQIINGQPSITVTDVDMGALPIPQSLKDQLKGLIPEGGLIQVSDLGFNTQNVQIIDGQLVISGVTK